MNKKKVKKAKKWKISQSKDFMKDLENVPEEVAGELESFFKGLKDGSIQPDDVGEPVDMDKLKKEEPDVYNSLIKRANELEVPDGIKVRKVVTTLNDIEKKKGSDVIKGSVELFKSYEKNKDKILREILNLFEKNNIEIPIAYRMILDIKRAFEKSDPKLLLSQLMAEKLSRELPNEAKDRINKKFDDEIDKQDVNRYRELAKKLNDKWNKGEKAEFIICGYKKLIKESKETKCKFCGQKVYFDEKATKGRVTKKVKLICIKCALTKYSKNLNNEQKIILKKVLKKWESK